nr:Dihydrofolate reductase [uncultured bacterium]
MIVSLVVAASENNVIGKDNKLLWRLPNDMAFFKNVTWGMPVIMGRKTFESLGSKPLKGRTNIVITRKGEIDEEVVTVSSLEQAVKAAGDTDAKECYIIGGGEIYRQSMQIADKIYMTRVSAVVEGDTWFPEIDEKVWRVTSSVSFDADEKHAYAYRFETWQRN